jgi:hypothetical protein
MQVEGGEGELRNPFFLPTKIRKSSKQNISIKLIGMMRKQQTAGAIVVYGSEKKQKVVTVGDRVAGFYVKSIDGDQLILQKKQEQLALHITS